MAYKQKMCASPEARRALHALLDVVLDVYCGGTRYIFVGLSNADKRTSICLDVVDEKRRQKVVYRDITDVSQTKELIQMAGGEGYEHDTAEQRRLIPYSDT